MFFNELEVGEYFSTAYNEALQRIPLGMGEHHRHNAVNVLSGLFVICGPEVSVQRIATPSYRKRWIEQTATLVVDDDREYQFGIGEASAHDDSYYAGSGLKETGDYHWAWCGRRGPMPEGQLWEECSVCNQEPVCSICFKCLTHCMC